MSTWFCHPMMSCTLIQLIFTLSFVLLLGAPVAAQQHRATRLGNPATRFAPPLATPEDLRARFRDEKLRPDIAEILRQWGWQGKVQDLLAAALTNEITAVSLPVGTRMPFMSSREQGKPICLRDVLWAGKEPVEAYAFIFSSKERRYRCVTPKPCSNFYLEDLGPEIPTAPALELSCAAPSEVLAGRPVEIVLTLANTGNGLEPKTTLALPIPPGATVLSPTEEGVTTPERVAWEVTGLAPKTSIKVNVILSTRHMGMLTFIPTARGTKAPPVQTECETRILGVPAILVEIKDLEDPIEVNQQVTYVITVTNQGDPTGTNIRWRCTLPASQEFVSGSGATAVQAEDRLITMEPLPTLAGKAAATWQVVTKALKVEDSRIKGELRSDQFEKPIRFEESTHLY